MYGGDRVFCDDRGITLTAYATPKVEELKLLSISNDLISCWLKKDKNSR